MDHIPISDEPFAPELLATEPAMERPGLLTRWAFRSAGAIVQDAMLEVTRDRCHAQLTKATLEHLGVLSAMEAQMSAATPQSSARYRAIVDAYTIRAVQRIAEGDDYGP